jgi:hypothetical protein
MQLKGLFASGSGVRRAGASRSLIACALLWSVSVAANAGTLKLRDSHGSGPGGEFSVTSFTPAIHAVSLLGANVPHLANSADFQTFCVEKDEFINFNVTYYWKVSGAAEDGGIGGPSPDPLSPETAYLFAQFWKGTLSSYFDNPLNRVTMANELQEAIWYLEEEITSVSGQAATWVTEAQNSGWTDTGQVRVLNLYSGYNAGVYSGNKQDQLVMVVPTPTGVGAGAAMLVALGIYNHRRRRSRAGASAVEVE